jgi:hypothetical protein
VIIFSSAFSCLVKHVCMSVWMTRNCSWWGPRNFSNHFVVGISISIWARGNIASFYADHRLRYNSASSFAAGGFCGNEASLHFLDRSLKARDTVLERSSQVCLMVLLSSERSPILDPFSWLFTTRTFCDHVSIDLGEFSDHVYPSWISWAW